MKTTLLSILAAFLLVFSAPLLAQSEEPYQEPQDPQETSTPEAEASAEASVTVTEEVEAETHAAETEEFHGADVSAEASVDAEFDSETDIAADDEALPRTASPLALLALMGLTAAGSALGLRSARRRK